jgi:hypothetical protein
MHTLRVAFHLYVWRIFQLPITRFRLYLHLRNPHSVILIYSVQFNPHSAS